MFTSPKNIRLISYLATVLPVRSYYEIVRAKGYNCHVKGKKEWGVKKYRKLKTMRKSTKLEQHETFVRSFQVLL